MVLKGEELDNKPNWQTGQTHWFSHINSEEKMFFMLYNHNEADQDWEYILKKDDILKKDCPLFLSQSTCINPWIHREQYKCVSDGFVFTKTLLSINHLHLKTISTINVRTWPICRAGLIHEQNNGKPCYSSLSRTKSKKNWKKPGAWLRGRKGNNLLFVLEAHILILNMKIWYTFEHQTEISWVTSAPVSCRYYITQGIEKASVNFC